jgi:hypothetical protein
MKTAKVILLAVVGLLLVADIHWRFRIWNSNAEIRAFAQQFKIEVLHTNDMSGIGIFKAKIEEPIWTEFSQDGKPLIENYYFHGKDVFDITLSSNRPPKYGVWFRNSDKSVTWWLDRHGIGSFTERIFYDTNSDFSKHEVWYHESWQVVDRRNEKNGIVINGQWHQLAFDTNGMWTIETETNQ